MTIFPVLSLSLCVCVCVCVCVLKELMAMIFIKFIIVTLLSLAQSFNMAAIQQI